VSDATSPLPFHDDDLKLLSVEAVSTQVRASRAFVRLCLTAGCPTRAGKLSAAELLNWLFENYNDVRELAGLHRFVPVEELPARVMRRIKMANALFTLFEFGESRASNLLEKAQLRRTRKQVEQALDQL
jgi:hypothetical protein